MCNSKGVAAGFFLHSLLLWVPTVRGSQSHDMADSQSLKVVWRVQSEAAAQGTEFVVLQGFFVRSGADVSSVEAANNYTYRRDIVASQGGPQFLATLYETLPPQKQMPSTYQVCLGGVC